MDALRLEGYIPLLDAIPFFLRRRNGKYVSRQTLNDYVNAGVRVNGVRVRLETLKVGGLRFVHPDAVREFIGRCTGKLR